MAGYRKLIAAVVGLSTLFASRYGFDLIGTEALMVDLIIEGATAWAVWRVPNARAA